MGQVKVRLSKSIVGEQEKQAVWNVISRGYLGMGQETQAFEKELSQYLHAGEEGWRVACVNTGTAAVHLGLQGVGVGPGDEVLAPSLTFVATFQAIAATGATPIACDVRLSDGLIDLEDAERRVTARTRAIVPVHYASEPGNLSEVYRFAKKHGLRVVEDAAHAFGCTHEGKLIGQQGDVVCFSFDGIKNITSGEGGLVVSRDASVMERVCDARLLAVQKDTEKRFSGTRSWEFDVVDQGWRYHMSDIMAAIGRVQLVRFENEFKAKRMELGNYYRENLQGLRGIELLARGEGTRVPHIMPIRVLDNKRDLVRAALGEYGFETGIHYKPNHLLTKFKSGPLAKAEQLYSELLTLPLHPEVSKADIDSIVDKIKQSI